MHLRFDGLHYGEYAGTGPGVLKVVCVNGAAFSGATINQCLCASLYPHPLSAIFVSWNRVINERVLHNSHFPFFYQRVDQAV